MKLQEQELSYLEVKQLADDWSEGYGISSYDDWCHPFTNQIMSIISVLWLLHTERRMSVRGMRLHFERYMRAVAARV
jgi:hypothetical protein